MKYVITKNDADAPGLDVYQDSDEPPTIPLPRKTPIGMKLAAKILELEERSANYDIDEVLAGLRSECAA